jgi:hypothetical protein
MKPTPTPAQLRAQTSRASKAAVRSAQAKTPAQIAAAQQEAQFNAEKWAANLKAYKAECRRNGWSY